MKRKKRDKNKVLKDWKAMRGKERWVGRNINRVREENEKREENLIMKKIIKSKLLK